MRVRIQHLQEPSLLFGKGITNPFPRDGLHKGGILSVGESPKLIPIGVVALESEFEAVETWINRLDKLSINATQNRKRFPAFPGTSSALGVKFDLNAKRHSRKVSDSELKSLMSRNPTSCFDKIVELYARKIESLQKDDCPLCVIVALPEELATLRISNPALDYREKRLLERLQSEADEQQMDLFDTTSKADIKTAKELLPQADTLLYRFFYRTLKARTMRSRNAIPIQIVRKHTYGADSGKQDDATTAWNISVGIAYKAREIPWQPHGLPANTCYVGISFHHLKRRSGDIVYASLAQAYSTDTEPYAIKGQSIPRDQKINKQPYLKANQAKEILDRVCQKFTDEAGYPPSRIVVHKTSKFVADEIEGFRECLNDGVGQIDMVSMRGTGLRLITNGVSEIQRGSLVEVEGSRHFLFTSGFVDKWESYPGPHIPSPLEVDFDLCSDPVVCAKEILALTKMNWNSAEGIGRIPITLSFARQVGMIMTELADEDEVEPSYRFYM